MAGLRPKRQIEEMGCEPDAPPTLASELNQVLSRITSVIDALYDTAALQNPDAFVMVARPTRKPVTPGAPILFYQNLLRQPALLFLEVEPTVTFLPGALIVGREAANATLGGAIRVVYDTAPKASVIVPPNGEVYVDITHPDGLATALNVQFTVIPLRGRSSIFTQGAV